MKPTPTFTAAMVFGFAATLLAQPSQNTKPNENSPGKPVEARFSPDGKKLVVTSPDNTVRFWDVQTGKPVSAEAWFSPDGEQLVIDSTNKTVKVWDAQTGKLLLGSLPHL